MDATGSASLNTQASMFAFNKAKDVKNEEVLGALGMTPETQKAQAEIDNSIKEAVASTTGQGAVLDIQA